MIEEKREKRAEQSEEQVNIQEILFRYLIHWPWFVFSVIVCIACAWGYLRLTTPVYNISATVLIKDDKKGSGASMSSELERMGLDGFVSSSNNVDNEIEVLRSKSLAREVPLSFASRRKDVSCSTGSVCISLRSAFGNAQPSAGLWAISRCSTASFRAEEMI